MHETQAGPNTHAQTGAGWHFWTGDPFNVINGADQTGLEFAQVEQNNLQLTLYWEAILCLQVKYLYKLKVN